MQKTLSMLIPKSVEKPLKKYVLRYVGWGHYCPVCENWQKSFDPFGIVPRPNALCPFCHSLERHRAVWFFFTNKTNLFDGSPKKMLHIAPEPQFEKRLKQIPGLEYLTADLYDPCAMIKMDITNIQYPDNSFDIIYCSHVLEHVPDDRKAMRELSRVLHPDGWAVLVIPISSKKTFEDPSVTDPSERLRLFGKEDHVRRYGPDFQDRLEEEGFKVRRFTEVDVVGENNAVKFGVTRAPIFFCEKKIGISNV